jgi:AAA domain
VKRLAMAKKANIIAIYSLKGGVGKTSLAVNLAAESAMVAGRKTLLWDLDPQAAASYILGNDDTGNGDHKASSIFTRDIDVVKLVIPTSVAGLDLLPADKSLRHLDRSLFEIGKKRRLAKLTGELAGTYDRIILDCPPGLTEVSEQIMRAADIIIVPVIPSALSRRALHDVVTHLRSQKNRGCRYFRWWIAAARCIWPHWPPNPNGPAYRWPARSSKWLNVGCRSVRLRQNRLLATHSPGCGAESIGSAAMSAGYRIER